MLPIALGHLITGTQTAVYHDMRDGNVFITQDEGKIWDRAVGIPSGDAAMVIEHPFDSRYVRILDTLL